MHEGNVYKKRNPPKRGLPAELESVNLMHMVKRAVLVILLSAGMIAPVRAQQKLYPITADEGFGSMRLQAAPTSGDAARLVAQKAEYSLRIGYPTDIEAGSLSESDADVIMLWMKIQNLSSRPMDFDPTKFTAAGEGSKTYRMLSPDEALDLMIAANGGLRKSVLSKATQGISLGKLGKSDEVQARDEAKRFALQAGTIQPQGIREGLLFFEAPSDKRFTVGIRLGELWSKPFTFTNVKPKGQ